MVSPNTQEDCGFADSFYELESIPEDVQVRQWVLSVPRSATLRPAALVARPVRSE